MFPGQCNFVRISGQAHKCSRTHVNVQGTLKNTFGVEITSRETILLHSGLIKIFLQHRTYCTKSTISSVDVTYDTIEDMEQLFKWAGGPSLNLFRCKTIATRNHLLWSCHPGSVLGLYLWLQYPIWAFVAAQREKKNNFWTKCHSLLSCDAGQMSPLQGKLWHGTLSKNRIFTLVIKVLP